LKNTLTVGGLFSGVGGIELGFMKAGFSVLWANEMNKYCAKTYKNNFDHKLYEKGIEELSGDELEPVDILTAGFPCQAFSVAGYRKGFNDERGNVFFEIVRLIKELKKKPKVLFLENVKNLKSHDKGNTFRRICEEIYKLDYSIFTDVLNTADYTAIPQNRERTFLICFRDEKGWQLDPGKNRYSRYFFKLFPPKTTKNLDHISKYFEKNVDEYFYYRQDRYMYPELRASIKSQNTLYQWRRIYVRENKSNMCPTLTANMGTGGHNVPLLKDDEGFRKLTPRECFNFQGFPKSFKFPSDVPNSQLYKQAGNAVTVKLIEKLARDIRKALENN
tara:strand:- start:704 stop:1699 length:996 start_codon:yes stop_codon:yes gene_type:complete